MIEIASPVQIEISPTEILIFTKWVIRHIKDKYKRFKIYWHSKYSKDEVHL
jgi:hypothetical protein